MFNYFNNTKSPIVSKTLTIEEIFSIIKDGDKNTEKILQIRELGKSHPLFASLKETLPTVRFNFRFDRKASNDRILSSTGVIYIDVDACDSIDLSNEYIYATWKSVSNTGYSILVKVDGLSKDNFNDTYKSISSLLNLSTDIGAKKATQQTILSFDSNLYINENSLTFIAENKKVQNGIILEKKERLIIPNVTFSECEYLRFNNISDYFIDSDEEYIYFEEKEKLCIPFIPNGIEEGRRNVVLYFNLSQFALLNPMAGIGVLKQFADQINSRFYEQYSDVKILSIVNAIIKQREEDNLQPYFNKERRIIFNPKYKLTAKEKIQKTNQIMGTHKTEQTKKEIYTIIENWDFETEGKITQQGVAEKSGKVIRTIKRYWPEFKEYVKTLNKDLKSNNEVEVVSEPISTEKEVEISSNEVLTPYKQRMIKFVENQELNELDVERIIRMIKNNEVETFDDIEEVISLIF